MLRLCAALFFAAAAAESSAWPWPPRDKNETTTLPPVSPTAPGFAHGVAQALGFDHISSCIKDTSYSVDDLWVAAKDYYHGNWVTKAKALANIGKAIEEITQGLGPCSSIMTDAANYKKLIKYLKDPRYYTMHNALTLSLNMAEDHKKLSSFTKAWQEGDYHAAGFEITTTVLEVLENPGIPRSNGTAAAQVAFGFAEGFVTGVDFKCFKDARVEIPAIAGGVMDIMSVIDIVGGLESLFHGLEGLVPCLKDCMADRPEIMSLLHSLGDFRHPDQLAKKFGNDIVSNSLDLSLETASFVLDYKGGEWERVGQDVGKILSKIVIGSAIGAAAQTVLV